MTLKIVVEAIKAAAIAMWTAITAATKPSAMLVVSTCCTKIIVATIAPGPAKSGVPKGTNAILESPSSPCFLAFPVKSSSATSNSNSAPAACSASIEIFR